VHLYSSEDSTIHTSDTSYASPIYLDDDLTVKSDEHGTGTYDTFIFFRDADGILNQSILMTETLTALFFLYGFLLFSLIMIFVSPDSALEPHV
jgi:hypothetical protein